MTIRKNNPNSPFWRAAQEASDRYDRMPDWKKGILHPRPLPMKAIHVKTLLDSLEVTCATRDWYDRAYLLIGGRHTISYQECETQASCYAIDSQWKTWFLNHAMALARPLRPVPVEVLYHSPFPPPPNDLTRIRLDIQCLNAQVTELQKQINRLSKNTPSLDSTAKGPDAGRMCTPSLEAWTGMVRCYALSSILPPKPLLNPC